MMNVAKIKKLKENAIIPTRGSAEAAGYDLYACLDSDSVVVKAGETVLIGTGLSIAVPKNTFGAIFARSGLASKKGLAPANKVGVCDSDYLGEYKVALHNHSKQDAVVENGERIAQLVVVPYVPCEFQEVDELDSTERGEGGFGSTGSK